MGENDFDLLEPLPVRPDEVAEKEIWHPLWHCFCCQDTGKIQLNLVRRVIPSYNYERDRLPICQNCHKGHDWFHLNDLGVIDTRLGPQICRKLNNIAREDWRLTTQIWFEMVKQRLENATEEITSEHNLRRRDRISEEFILAKKKHELARGDWEEIEEDEEEVTEE
ncbi:MAG: hypothetical protein PUP91_06925 [Rhizonema sp. PD37]|nr:hypothetical protein [Rhizonema sp. PD37]